MAKLFDETVPDGPGSPVAVDQEYPIVVGCVAGDIDLVFLVPPPADIGVVVELRRLIAEGHTVNKRTEYQWRTTTRR